MENSEQALTLHKAAKILSCSYGTLWHLVQRGDIPAFRLGRSWRIWPDDLVKLSHPKDNQYRLALRKDEVTLCQSASVVKFGGSISARQTASELEDLLKQQTGKPRKNYTTD